MEILFPMKTFYTILCFLLTAGMSASYAQTVNQIYDHDTTDLTQLHNMPFDESRLLVVSGYPFSSGGLTYHELDQGTAQLIDLSFPNVDTIRSFPKFTDDKIFFEASVTGAGKEIVAYDGTSVFIFDITPGPGSSHSRLIEFEGEIYAIANLGTFRQLYRYTETGSPTFELVSGETDADVVDFIARRNNAYYYTTFNPTTGRKIKVTTDNGGTLTHSLITPTSYQESVGDVVLLNNDIYFLSNQYTTLDASYRVDKIDINNNITTHYYETAGNISSAKLLAYNGDILYYRTEPGSGEILNISVAGQSFTQIAIDPIQYNLIGNHVVQNGKLFIYGDQYILNVSSNTPVPVIEDGFFIQITPAYQTNDAFYVYEISPNTAELSGIIEVSSLTNQLITYPVATEAGYMDFTTKMVENNGEVAFIFRTNGSASSTDIYSLASLLSTNENVLAHFDAYPNPVSNGTLSLDAPQTGDLIISNIEGQRIASVMLHAGINTIDLSHVSSGVYLLHYGNTVQRILVESF